MVTRIALLGSTGSIGRQTLQVVRSQPGRFQVVALGAGTNLDLLRSQVAEFHPHAVSSPGLADASYVSPRGVPNPTLLPLDELAALPDADLVVIATAGKAGLVPTLRALEAGKQVALANKEALVIAGELVMATARRRRVAIRPIDSEHSAVWQCLWGERAESVERLLLTASGGAFRDLTPGELAAVTPEMALHHPTWLMGRKVTIDSASLMNKGLEVMEAHWLFGLDYDRVSVILHRESIVHSMVEFADGSIKAQLSLPDMRFPILCALCYPDRLANPFPRLDLTRQRSLTFGAVDMDRYPCLKLAYQAGRAGGTYPAALSVADEVAVDLFLAGKLAFAAIPEVVSAVLQSHQPSPATELEAILAADAWGRKEAVRVASMMPATSH